MFAMINDKDCIFCKIARKEIPSEFVYENDNFFAILDIHPIAEGHTLIIPKKHFINILDMPASMGEELISAIKDVSSELIKNGKAEGFNVLQSNEKVAQQEVFHLHFHIIPRKKNDGLKCRFK